MSNNKSRHTVWLENDTWQKVEDTYRSDNCLTRNEYIDRAIQFYTGFLKADRAEAYLPVTLSDVMENKVQALGNRFGRLMFKFIVELSMMMHIIASDTDISYQTLEKLRERCILDAKRTHGEIDFGEVLKFQRRED